MRPALRFWACRDFNPLPPCGGRRSALHREEGADIFQSTPSVWRETMYMVDNDGGSGISIHSLRVEGDASVPILAHDCIYFNPLPPCGGRRLTGRIEDRKRDKFQSTPSVWRETMESHESQMTRRHFNPLPPCGGRRDCERGSITLVSISIHSLRVEGDLALQADIKASEEFQSTPSVWRETLSSMDGTSPS